MSDSNRTYRIRTKVNHDNMVTFDLKQGVDMIELLSLKIDTTNYYKLHTSNYGCIVGRVLANGGVGIPNAKVSVFFATKESPSVDSVLYDLYPFATAFSKNDDGIRYNLLPDTNVTVCHTPVGTFPNKRLALDDESLTEVYEKYYKYTTRTNDAGDYMLFGVPVGEQVVHVDIDLSDIGMLSQKPYDMIYKGYNITQFENANKFKGDTNLDSLTQIITENDSVNVFPFWGDGDSDTIKITRHDVNVQYKFEPSCVFMGSMITDERSNGVQKNCVATERMGKMDRLTTGSGTIEMIRKCADGSVEEFQVQGNQLIDGNGTWCYQIPMNLDYYMTDEYGNFVPSDEKDKGIPTRTRVRFRVSMTDFQSEYQNNHLSKVLIPNNPKTYDDLDYNFGTYTQDDKTGTKSFRDLFWNNVYTVKSYIPRIQKGNWSRNKRFTGIKNVNVNEGNNPIPYNNMRVNLTFMFVLQCAMLKFIIAVTRVVNKLKIIGSKKTCSYIGDGVCPDLENWYFAPGCKKKHLDTTLDGIRSDNDPKSIDSQNRDKDDNSSYCITNQTNYLMQCVEINLAMEYNVIQFDFYNDWINGLLYIPRWFVNIKKKRSYLFGLIHRRAKVEACMEATYHITRRYTQQCALVYEKPSQTAKYYTKVVSPRGCGDNSRQKCHTGLGRNHVKIFRGKGGGGLVHSENSLSGDMVYYFKPAEWLNVNNNNYNTKCPLFATDIVLLGSLDDYNQYGIPKAFEELVSSTYLMPPNLAATNMDKEGYMYGLGSNSSKGTRCKGGNIFDQPVQVAEQKFENYVEWSRNTDFYEDSPDDSIEYPITEASGIDWGYSGPNQGENSLTDLYFPGGHFLGISCFNAQTNIKSCVNLSRLCEIGSIMSQRQEVVSGDDSNVESAHLMPTGLVSKYEITDGNFRKMFATMNHNGLKTKVNPDTAYLEYDFVTVLPTNFNGDLESFVKNSSNYNRRGATEAGDSSKYYLYTSTVEKPSDDYYRFRMGIHDDDTDIRNHYLLQNGNKVSLPVYENSYYFYFGLKDGNTALDRFFKNFYAKCEGMVDDDKRVIVTTEPEKFCAEGGSVKVSISDLSCPYTIMLTKKDSGIGNGSVQYISKVPDHYVDEVPFYSVSPNYIEGVNDKSASHCFDTFYLTGYLNEEDELYYPLQSGDYTLTIVTEEDGNIEINFGVSVEIVGQMADVSVSMYDFVEGYENYDENYLQARTGTSVTENGGYIVIDNADFSTGSNLSCVAILSDDKYVILTSNSNGDVRTNMHDALIREGYLLDAMTALSYSPSWATSIGGGKIRYTVPVWRGNDSYNVSIMGSCNKTTTIATSYISMGGSLNYYVGDTDLTYLNALSALTSQNDIITSGWVQTIIYDNSNTYTAKQKWNVKQTVYYRNTLYSEIPNGNINIRPFNGMEPYVDATSGKVETLIEYDDYVYVAYSSAITLNHTIDGMTIADDNQYNDMYEFFMPTHYGILMNGTQQLRPFDKFGLSSSNPYINFNGYKPSVNLNISNPLFTYFAPPTYIFKVNDTSGKQPPMSLEVPSIYKPFFFNALCLIYTTKSSDLEYNAIRGLVALNNGMEYDNYRPSVEININDSIVSNHLPDSYSNDPLYKYSTYLFKNQRKTFTGEISGYTFTVECGDAAPKNYDGEITPLTISESVSCTFPTPNNVFYTSGVRFYIDKNSIYAQYSENKNWIDIFITNVLGANIDVYETLSYDYTTADSNKWKGIYGFYDDENRYHEFTDVTDGVYQAIYQSGEGTPWNRFVQYITDLAKIWVVIDGHPKETQYLPHVLAIYDNWTKTESSCVWTAENMFQHVTPDTNIISIAKYYGSSDLVTI